ncbi:hypothetical protein [uncultured Parolsenella sp.]|uniref:hypothetical protein n=1 Tax=uncultured Parolsenella sp. TaxID=2083008 RepID=UPI0027D93F01|nr:hypothetical protein [uncultured Parolsenella sp.]
MLDLTKLTTEQRNPKTMEPDTFTPLQTATVMNEENENVVRGLGEVLPQVATAIEWAAGAATAHTQQVTTRSGTFFEPVTCPAALSCSGSTTAGHGRWSAA